MRNRNRQLKAMSMSSHTVSMSSHTVSMSSHTMSMSSHKIDAIQTLEHNNTTPEIIINTLQTKPNQPMMFTNDKGEKWTFITRKQNRVYLMAKTPDMKKYEEICYKANY